MLRAMRQASIEQCAGHYVGQSTLLTRRYSLRYLRLEQKILRFVSRVRKPVDKPFPCKYCNPMEAAS